MTSTRPLAEERDALRHVIDRLMNEETSLETLCKYLPRLLSVSANVARIQSALESNDNAATDALIKALAELNAEDVEQNGW